MMHLQQRLPNRDVATLFSLDSTGVPLENFRENSLINKPAMAAIDLR